MNAKGIIITITIGVAIGVIANLVYDRIKAKKCNC